jgi:predicted acylesterase/phospholipase RssA
MPANLIRVLVVGLALAPLGCGSSGPFRDPSPVKAGVNPADLEDVCTRCDAGHQLDMRGLFQVAEQVRLARKPAAPPPKKSVLVLSGGGTYGAYSAGVLVGWSETGTRPEFDVVTGISTGALIAPMAFLGPAYDPQLRNLYTTLRNEDLYRVRRSLRGLLFADSVADNAPMVRKVEELVTPEVLCQVAAEHQKGRRLYVGTTELDGRRFVVWDMGAIACRGTPADLELFRKILLGSSAIPGFFPPQEIPVTVDGRPFTERHVDGGVSAALFFRPPYVPPEQRNDPVAASLAGTDLYMLVAGKLYADPEPVRPRALPIAATSVSTVIYAQARGDLMKLYTACVLTGMNYQLSAIPPEFVVPASSTDFDPVEMTRMFEEGRKQVPAGTAWRTTPPGYAPGEGVSLRSGTVLTRVANGPPRGPGTGPAIPVVIPPAPVAK